MEIDQTKPFVCIVMLDDSRFMQLFREAFIHVTEALIIMGRFISFCIGSFMFKNIDAV